MSEEQDVLGRRARTVGRIKGFKRGTLTILTPNGRFQRVATSPDTTVVVADLASIADVEPGERVVVKYETDRSQAREVIVLPADDAHGLMVTAVDEAEITVKNHIGALSTIGVVGATIDKAHASTLEGLETGAIVFGMLAVSDYDALTALELIVLPETTAFGS